MHRDGFTLIEVLVASALLVVAVGAIWQTWMNAQESAALIDQKITATDGAFGAISEIRRELRQASMATLSTLPAGTLSYRVAEDVDGNGLAVDRAGALEVGEPRAIQRDENDANHDGMGASQLVLVSGATVRVLANNLLDSEDVNQNGALDSGEDVNGNGVLETGIWFAARDGGIQITVQTTGKTRRGFATPVALSQWVLPRNT